MTIADAIFQACPEIVAQILASASEVAPMVHYVTRKKWRYEQVLERVRWLSENATLLKGSPQPV